MELKYLSNHLHVSTSSLCILLNKLVEKGYVDREEDKKIEEIHYMELQKKDQKYLMNKK